MINNSRSYSGSIKTHCLLLFNCSPLDIEIALLITNNTPPIINLKETRKGMFLELEPI